MKRSLALPVLALAATLVGAACSSSNSKSSVSFDPGLCARVSGCFGSLDGNFGESCELIWGAIQEGAVGGLGTEDQLTFAAVQCVANAADCTAMKACTQATPAQAAACGTSLGEVCSGDALVDCGSKEATNCASAGAHCFASGGNASCGTAACDSATAQPSCDGDLLVECSGAALRSRSCAFSITEDCSGGTTGSTCTTLVSDTCAVVGGKAQCVGSGAACDATTFKTSCDGTAIVSCTGGKTARFDCAQFGPELTCQANGDGSVNCGGTAKQCTAGTAETCADGVITYCWFGTTTTLDCKQYGLSGCSTTMASGSTWARCTE
jgi:hypothetical protein